MAGGRARLDAFLAGLRDFAVDSGFVDWFAAQASGHRAMLAGCRAALDRDYVADLVDYFGERCDSYTLILAPLAHAGGFGPRVRRADGGRAAFAVVGPKSIEDGVPAFGTPAQLRRLLWHELSHSHVNHLTERYLDGFMGPVTDLQGHIRPEVERYVPWDVHVADWVSEHVVRGITTRLAYRELGRAEGDAALELELTGFPFTAEVAARLEQYERRRDRYPTLADFYPELVALFESVAG
ncbi:MAG: DUF4932 domain-containing protein [Gemmatimonadota bacterium]